MSKDAGSTKPFAGWCRITCNDRETPGALTSRTSLVLHPTKGVFGAHTAAAPSATTAGKVAAANAFLFELHGGSLKPLQLEGDNAILTGTTVHISEDAAKLLNSTFKTDAVKRGLLVGTATITAQIK
ncbi:hypothetical protein [Curtobacterium flaccumfaciens]|uniref:hypothetical protein n=1 Tax=Curtobacterium flaccumfaciens TaxID=2035 RepID=UPI0016037FA5|nr:hypothetical protein [Curtobacterium flaccumfaciens]MBB1198610.1 hypothetical protein [Curtobacterium flaccumfaciens]